MSITRFHWLDYTVTVVMLLVPIGIGIFFAFFKGGQKTKVEYLLGNREMNMLPVCLSLFVTYQSAISLIGIPSDTYDTGPMIMFVNIGLSLAYIVGFFTVVPLMYPLHLTSIYHYFEMRFQSNAVRMLGTCIGMLQTVLYMGVALFSPALALQTAAGLPLWVSVAIVGAVGTVYTAVGGIKTVVWTDAFQTVIVFVGISAVIIKGVLVVGGLSEVAHIATEGGRTDFAVLTPDPRERHSMLASLVGASIMWLTNCFNQSTVQRIGALRTLKAAKIVFIANFPLTAFYGACLTFTGIVLYAYIVTTGCDPYEAGLISNKNQMMPYFVIHSLVDLPGMAGLYMSMLFSGALSTLSSGINALAANTVEDVLGRPLRSLKDTTVTLIAKFLVLLYGGLTIGLAYLMKSMAGPVTQLASSAFGACGGPMVGMFLLGGSFPRANKYGAFGGGLVGLAVNWWITIGTRLYGAPIATLPPGPTHSCFNSSWAFPGNVSTSAPHFNVSMYDVELTHAMYGVVTTATVDDSLKGTYKDRPFSIYDISYLWFGAIGLLITYIVGVIISCVTGCQDPEALDTRLIFPFCRKLYGMREPLVHPEDTSNVVVMKYFRQVVNTPIEMEVTDSKNSLPLDKTPLKEDELQKPELRSFLNGNRAENEEQLPTADPAT